MHYVYILQSHQDDGLYIGCTNNVRRRFEGHNNEKSYYTKHHGGPWRMVYLEGYAAEKDAYQREKSLKQHAQGLRRIKERLQHSLTHVM